MKEKEALRQGNIKPKYHLLQMVKFSSYKAIFNSKIKEEFTGRIYMIGIDALEDSKNIIYNVATSFNPPYRLITLREDEIICVLD